MRVSRIAAMLLVATMLCTVPSRSVLAEEADATSDEVPLSVTSSETEGSDASPVTNDEPDDGEIMAPIGCQDEQVPQDAGAAEVGDAAADVMADDAGGVGQGPDIEPDDEGVAFCVADEGGLLPTQEADAVQAEEAFVKAQVADAARVEEAARIAAQAAEDARYLLREASYVLRPISNGGLAYRASIHALERVGYGVSEQLRLMRDANGWYFIVAADGSGRLAASGANVTLAKAASSDAQRWRIERRGTGYVLINKATDKALDVSGGVMRAGTRVGVYVRNGTAAQTWSFYDMTAEYAALDSRAAAAATALPDGTYVLRTDVATRTVVDISGGSKANGGNAQVYVSNMTAAQLWVVSHDVQGYVTFKNVGSGRVLDVAGGSAANSTNVQQYVSNGTRAQKWIVERVGSSWQITSALKQGVVLDVAGGSSRNGANIQVYSSNNTKAQRITPYSTKPAVASGADLSLSGYYTIVPAVGAAYALDVTGGSKNNGTNVQEYVANGTFAQMWSFSYVGGYYQIISGVSGRALDFAGGNPLPGTNAQQYEARSNTPAQLFSVRANTDGSYTFVNVATGLALDVESGRVGNGVNIRGWTPNGAAAQRFFLKTVGNLLASGLYEVSPSYATNRRLDVSGGSTADGANVQIYAGNGSFAQKWNVTPVSGKANIYTLQAVNSGRYLAANTSGNAIQTSRLDASSQWRVSLVAGNLTLSNVGNNKMLDVVYGSTANGANVQTHVPNGHAAQRFVFTATAPISNGYYLLHFSSKTGQVVEVGGGSSANGANVQSYASNDSGGQKWYLMRKTDGTYSIRNANSGRYLDVAGGSSTSGANVQQYTGNNTKAQSWRIVYTGGAATFKLVSALGKELVLSTPNAGTPGNGTNVVIAKDQASSSQRFSLTATTYVPPNPMVSKAQGYSSATNWLVLVDTTKNQTAIFNGSRGSWTLNRQEICSTGWVGSPTVKGEFTVQNKGYSFSGHGYTCYYWTQFYRDYLFHSVKYNQGTFRIQDGRLGFNISAGCVRLDISVAKWIQDNVPRGSKVVIY